ncbi:MAG: hypothetical protein K8S87_03425 [Planctomycetes bacterium]|nr:hypothetical protein [Planctomycetota bacterium]
MKSMSDKKGKSKKLWRIILKILIIITIIVLLIYVIAEIVAHFKYESIINGIRSKGEPVSLSEYEYPMVIEQNNGASFIEHAFSQHDIFKDMYPNEFWDAFEFMHYETDSSVQELFNSPDKQQKLKSWLDINQQTFQLLQKGLEFPEKRFELVKYVFKDIETIGTFSTKCINLAWLLCGKMNQSICNKDKSQAIADFNTLVDFAVIWNNEIEMYITESSFYSFDEVLKALRVLVDNVDLTEEDINVINAKLDELLPSLDMSRFLILARCLFLDYVKLLDNDPMNLKEDAYGDWKTYVPDSHMKLMLLKAVENSTKLIELTKMPYFNAKSAIEDMKTDAMNWFGVYYDADVWTIIAIGTHFDRVISTAQYRIAKITLAAKIFELRNDRKPESIDELVKIGLIDTEAIDPFTGKQFKLVIIDDELIIYSVGPNGVDDFASKQDTSNSADLFWISRFVRTQQQSQLQTQPEGNK